MTSGNRLEHTTATPATNVSSRYAELTQLDHHCVWVNNCLGAGNMKFFTQFLYCSFYYCLLYCTIGLLALFNMAELWGSSKIFEYEKANPAEKVKFA